MAYRGGATASAQQQQQQQQQTARPMTPQLWHPENNNNSRNSLDEIDDEDRRRNKEAIGEPKLKKKRKNLKALIRSFRKPDPVFEVKGTGRMAQFSNERLYLHWIRFGILQSGIAVTLLNYGNNIASMVGVAALILALLTLIYGTTLYHLRHLYMVTKRKDVIYFARRIPTLLCLGLFVIYLANFLVNMTVAYDVSSRPPWAGKDPTNPASVY
ncbi:vacuolar transporter chaperone [Mortierella sp. AD031]|nr:vacuolar transporter chaperone [Mortierella sp. AD031]